MSVKMPWRVGGELVDPNVSLDDRKQLAELLGQAISDLQDQLYSITGGVATVGVDGNVVLHGDTVPADMENAELHRDLTGDDLHVPKAHAPSHAYGGTDPLTIFQDWVAATGVCNGINDTFVLPFTPNPATSVEVLTDQMMLVAQPAHFSLLGNVMTIAADYIPRRTCFVKGRV